MLAAFFVLAFILAVLGQWDESFEGWLEEKVGAATGSLATGLTNFLGLGAGLGAAGVATGPVLTLLGVGVAAYFTYRLAMVVKRAVG